MDSSGTISSISSLSRSSSSYALASSSEQSAPPRPAAHTHFPMTHSPRFEHEFKQEERSSTNPDSSSSRASATRDTLGVVASANTWREMTPPTEQSRPVNPVSHEHTPVLLQRPWPEQSLGQRLTSQAVRGPCMYPASQVHRNTP